MPASVKSRVKSFKTFMETLELASLVENTKIEIYNERRLVPFSFAKQK